MLDLEKNITPICPYLVKYKITLTAAPESTPGNNNQTLLFCANRFLDWRSDYKTCAKHL